MTAEAVPFTPLLDTAADIERLGREPLIENCEGDPARLVILLDHLRTMRQALATIESAVEAAAAQAIGRERLELPGFTAVRKGGTKRTAWEHDRIATVVRERLLEAAAITYWRVGVLKAAGVRFDDLCESERGRFTIQISRSEP